MEAKGTVIDIGEDKYDGLGADSLVEIQAEISFKAGYEKCAGELETYLLKWKQAGIREVVEWLKQTMLIDYDELDCNVWRDQLRVWGVDKPKK